MTLLFGRPSVESWDVLELGHALETDFSKSLTLKKTFSNDLIEIQKG